MALAGLGTLGPAHCCSPRVAPLCWSSWEADTLNSNQSTVPNFSFLMQNVIQKFIGFLSHSTGTFALCATWTTSPVSMECCPRENQRKNPLRYNVITSLSLSTLSIFRGIFWISVMIKCHSQDPCQSLMSIIATNSMHSNVIFTNLIPQTKKLLLYNSPRIIFPL